jgi:hypothetical protein
MLAILVSSPMTFAEPTAADRRPPAAKSTEAKAAVALVSSDLIEPLAAKERKVSQFSRARLPPRDRRVRILDEHPRKDTDGNAFVRFAVDARHGFHADPDADESQWQQATITGCVYLDRSQVFVKRGDEYRPAAFLLGKNLKAAAESTCQPEAGQLAHAN